MPTKTYVPIATTTLSSNAASYTFSSIPQTYTDLILQISNAKSTINGYGFTFGVNGDTGNNYSGQGLSGNGTLMQAFRYSNTFGSTWVGGWLAGMSDTTPSQATLNFQNYANTTTYKTIVGEYGSAAKSTEASIWLWRGSTGSATQAINQITIYSQTGGANIASGTVMTLYGIH
jgi:hypothetical protein